MAAPPLPWDIHPKNIEESKELVAKVAAPAKTLLPAMREKLDVKLEPTTIGRREGFRSHAQGDRAGEPEPGFPPFPWWRLCAQSRRAGDPRGDADGRLRPRQGHLRGLSNQRRAPYPAALDDCVAVYRELLKTVPARNIAVFGTSTGGGLSMSLVLRAKQDGFALPAAIAPGSPWADLTKTGDTFYSHNLVDNFQVSYDGYLKDSAYLYAGGRDLKDPMLSPSTATCMGFRRRS